METVTQRFRTGSQVMLTDDAIENYGAKFRDRVFVVSHVATKYMKGDEFYARGRPAGFHPGYDNSTNCALYDCKGAAFSLYDWELKPATVSVREALEETSARQQEATRLQKPI